MNFHFIVIFVCLVDLNFAEKLVHPEFISREHRPESFGAVKDLDADIAIVNVINNISDTLIAPLGVTKGIWEIF